MISNVTRAKLYMFGIITVVTLSVTALSYMRLPQQLGIGRYALSVNLDEAGGLYPKSMVTYRGVEVGQVTSVELGANGAVVARLQIDNGTRLPRSSKVQVRSSSVIGEQFVNFLPTGDGSTDEFYGDGDTVPVADTEQPVTTTQLLTAVDGLVQSIPAKDLATAVNELGQAFDGTGDDLGRFLDASSTFQGAATANLPATLKLVDDSLSVLRTQQQLDPAIRSLAAGLDSFSSQLARSDSDLRGILTNGSRFMDEVGAVTTDLKPVLPGMLTEVAAVGEVGRVYEPAIEHVLTVAPAIFTHFLATIPLDQRDLADPAINLWFKLGFDPPACMEGFPDAAKMRSPVDTSPAPVPRNSYCKVAPNDPRVIRGARNALCPNGARAATAAACGLSFGPEVRDRSSAAGPDPRAVAEARGALASMGLPPDFLTSMAGTPSATTWSDYLLELVKS